jgi:hypothetical protein
MVWTGRWPRSGSVPTMWTRLCAATPTVFSASAARDMHWPVLAVGASLVVTERATAELFKVASNDPTSGRADAGLGAHDPPEVRRGFAVYGPTAMDNARPYCLSCPSSEWPAEQLTRASARRSANDPGDRRRPARRDRRAGARLTRPWPSPWPLLAGVLPRRTRCSVTVQAEYAPRPEFGLSALV